jgi:signal transduction histidine kinase
LTIVLGFVGGLVLSRTFLARVGAISRAAEKIAQSDLAERIPRSNKADDLDDLAGTLNRMLDRIAGLMATLRHVSNDIAHDLRTPLGKLRLRLDTVLRSAHTVGAYEAAVRRAIDDLDSVLETFAALLRIAQIEAGKRRSGFKQMSLSAMVQEVVEAFSPSAEESGHALSARIAAGVNAIGDSELVTQMLVNLTENSLNHTPAGTAIEISLERTSNGSCLSVADRGPGVPPEERERIFQKFYRLEQSRTTPGTGLGLSLVAAVADLHGVRVRVEDNQPGLLVALDFPLHGIV